MYKDYPAAYQVSKGSALQVDTAFYERVRDRKDQRRLIEQFEVPIRTGRAWKVPAGHVFRVTTPVGPQVGDELMAVKVPVHPCLGTAPRLESEDLTVEMAGGGQIVNGYSEMERWDGSGGSTHVRSVTSRPNFDRRTGRSSICSW